MFCESNTNLMPTKENIIEIPIGTALRRERRHFSVIVSQFKSIIRTNFDDFPTLLITKYNCISSSMV